MLDVNLQNFDKRRRQINNRHFILSQRYVPTVHDGMVVARPQYRKASFPWIGLVLIVSGLLVFKALLFVQIGPLAYEERVGKLANGTVMEQGGAYIMYADPITIWISGNFSLILKL